MHDCRVGNFVNHAKIRHENNTKIMGFDSCIVHEHKITRINLNVGFGFTFRYTTQNENTQNKKYFNKFIKMNTYF